MQVKVKQRLEKGSRCSVQKFLPIWHVMESQTGTIIILNLKPWVHTMQATNSISGNQETKYSYKTKNQSRSPARKASAMAMCFNHRVCHDVVSIAMRTSQPAASVSNCFKVPRISKMTAISETRHCEQRTQRRPHCTSSVAPLFGNNPEAKV